jgi:hypothetical protein
MFPPLKRYAIQVLVAAGRMQHVEIARFVGVGERTVRRVAKEAPVTEIDFCKCDSAWEIDPLSGGIGVQN